MKRTVTMNWNSQVEDDDDDDFCEPEGNESDDEEFGDTQDEFVTIKSANNPSPMLGDFNSWATDPGDIKDRRKKLLQGMGLGSNKSFMKLASTKINRIVSKKVDANTTTAPDSIASTETSKQKIPPAECKSKPVPAAQAETELVLLAPLMLVRSRSEGDIDPFSIVAKKRKEEVLGHESRKHFKRSSSMILTPSIGICQFVRVDVRVEKARGKTKSGELLPNDELGAFYLIRNLDTGSEFIVREGVWSKLTNLQTGKQLSLEEFEKTTGQSPVVKELMNANASTNNDDSKKAMVNANNYLNKTFRFSMKQGANLLKNIKAIVEGKDMLPPSAQNSNNSQWVRVRQQGKSYKELTGLHMCQEIQAHEGPIWTIKFSLDAKYLASAGEDKVIHVWEVQECDVQIAKPNDDSAATINTDRPPLPDGTPAAVEKKKKKTSNRKKSNGVPDYVSVPETVFGLSEKPICTLTGHTEDILDLSWSKTEQLLSSSMDKTVRLWNIETKECVKMFAHSDYVTCVQFNPINDDYFISGSLDARFRIWNITDRKVVDWTDLNEMVTAACFTPDAEDALVGSHKGNVRLYTTTDCKIEQKEIFEVRNKNKTQAKKITGFQFSPSSSSEVLLSCADSRVRIMEGSNVIQKFAGLRNTNSQIAASFTPNGKYIISASEDSHVYMWKHDEHKSTAGGKPKSVNTSTHAHEQFLCKDVSVAIPWPGCIKNVQPVFDINKKQSKKQGVPATGSPTKEEDPNNSKKDLPPLPKKNTGPEKSSSSQDEDLSQAPCTESVASDSSSVKSPKSLSATSGESASAKTGDSASATSGESESGKTDESESVKTNEPPSDKAGESSSTKSEEHPSNKPGESSLNKSGESSSNKASASLGSHSKSTVWSWFDAGGNAGHSIEPKAWGLVIVTAGLGGDIKAYQNFGLPVKVKSQANIFIAPQK